MITINRLLFMIMFSYVFAIVLWSGSMGGLFDSFLMRTSSVATLTDSSLERRANSKSSSQLRSGGGEERGDGTPQRPESWMILFQSEMCAPCQKARAEMELLSHDPDVVSKHDLHMGAIDAIKNPSSRKRFDIHSIPTIVYIEDGMFYEFRGHKIDRPSLNKFLSDTRDDLDGNGGGKTKGKAIPPAPGILRRTWDFVDAVNSNVRNSLGLGFVYVGYFLGSWFLVMCVVGLAMRCYLCFEGMATDPDYLRRGVANLVGGIHGGVGWMDAPMRSLLQRREGED